MSQNIAIALIGFAGAFFVLGAGFLALIAKTEWAKGKSGLIFGILGLIVAIGGGLGLVVGVMLAISTASEEGTLLDLDRDLADIVPGEGGIEQAVRGWNAVEILREDGIYDPTAHPGAEGCYGVAWNALDLDHTVIVFQSATEISFQSGGTYALICLTDNANLSARDVGRIQATWLEREHGGSWRVMVLD